MTKFGKKVNFRPLFVSLLIGLLFDLTFSEVFNPTIGFILGAALFLWIFLGYYWPTIRVTFDYWEIDNKSLRYSNMDSQSNRLNRTKNISIKGHCNLRQEIYGFIGKGTQISHCSGHPPQYIKLLTFEERLI